MDREKDEEIGGEICLFRGERNVHWDKGYCHAPQNIYTDDSTGSRWNGRCPEK
jgi:hypothetical protein